MCHNLIYFFSWIINSIQFLFFYWNDFIFTTRTAMDIIHRPTTHEENKTVYIKYNNVVEPATILSIPIDDTSDPYTLQLHNTNGIIEAMEDELMDHDPTKAPHESNPKTILFPKYPWIKHQAKVTIYLSDHMPKPQQGILHYDDNSNIWAFSPGRKNTQQHMPLPNFHLLVTSLVRNQKLLKGWVPLNVP